MRINSLSITDFKALKGTREFEFGDGIIGIVGANGQGKSTFTNSISWALYGPLALPKNSGSANVISWGGPKKSEVRLNFEVAGSEYSLVRSQGRVAEAHLTGAMTANGPEAVTKAVSEILGVDRVGFLASVFSRQLDLLGLASLDTGERTSTVIRLRGLDRVTRAVEKVNKAATETKRSLGALRAALPDPKPLHVYDMTVSAFEQNRARLEEEIGELLTLKEDKEREVDNLVKQQESLAEERQAYREYFTTKTILESRVTQATQTMETSEELASQPLASPPVAPARMADRAQVKSLTRSVASEREFIRNLKTTIAAKTVCPACGRAYDNADELKVSQDRAEKQLTLSTDKVSQLEDELLMAEDIVSTEDAYVAARNKWETVDRFRFDQYQENFNRCEATLALAIEELAALEPMVDNSDEYDNIVKQVQEDQRLLSFYSTRIAKLEGNIDLIDENIARALEEKKAAEKMAAKLSKLESKLLEGEVASGLLKSFKQDQISDIIPDISAKASDFLGSLTDGKYTELVLTPTWDIQYRYEDGELKEFANLSPGERAVFALSLRLAIADSMAGSISFMVLDEVFDSLDDDRQQAAWSLLEGMSSRYGQIFLITHVSQLKDRFPFMVPL